MHVPMTPTIFSDSLFMRADSFAVTEAADAPPLGIRHCPFDFLRLATHCLFESASWLDLAIDAADLMEGRAPASEPTVLLIASRRINAALIRFR